MGFFFNSDVFTWLLTHALALV